ncbi:MAG: hypothetical protein A2W95_08335 [Bacteroidetes bacterium GWA2_40_14]|jgi:endoglucanase|nr:MAG: hypothetical protein A2W95_08335 [Bacteroidetes bacterium GWA2_40_14]HAZ04230.1 hypothetical protein [Marinilabiliales bacterium]
MKRLLLISLLLLVSGLFIALKSQIPFQKGFNLSGWFQAENAHQMQFTKFTYKDFENLKSLGCDVVRLPINLHSMVTESVDYTLDPLFVQFLDSVVSWAEMFQIYLIIDNHTFNPSVNTSPNVGTILNKVWKQMAAHYKNRSKYIIYEVLNEPHGITTSTWGTIQKNAIDAIRTEDTEHYIIVGGAEFNSIYELSKLPVYTDSKLWYTFHFYEPFLFTHQGASWSTPSMTDLSGVPFPYNDTAMPECPASLKGTWIESSLNNYHNDGTIAKVKSHIDVALAFKNSRNVDIFCGEFGVYMPNSPDTDRDFWHQTVRGYFEENQVPWALWEYKGGFGIFNKNSSEMFDYDLNVSLVESLGLTVPEQHEYTLLPDSVGFRMYSDYIETNILDAAIGTQAIDFYAHELPNNGNYCLKWENASQYSSIGFNFNPDKDLSKLVSENYAFDCFVRGVDATTKFDLRFIDTKTDDSDHPWRMGITLDNSDIPMDSYWHHLRIPFTDFIEKGSWDVDTWYNPQGKFDWKAVDRFEIVAEHGNMGEKVLWFDNLHISNQDTAQIWETDPIVIENSINYNQNQNWILYPNPMTDNLQITSPKITTENVILKIFNLSGQLVFEKSVSQMANNCFEWKGQNNFGETVDSGIYFLQIIQGNQLTTYKIVKAVSDRF